MPFADPKKNISHFALSPGMKVADFGAGAGHYAAPMADIVGETGAVYVIDILPELVTKARTYDTNKRSNMYFIHGDVTAENGTTLASGVANVVVLSNILFQLTNRLAAVAEARRILKLHGRAVVIDWKGSYGGMGPAPEYVVTEDSVHKIFIESGFSFLRGFEAGDQHYGLIFRAH